MSDSSTPSIDALRAKYGSLAAERDRRMFPITSKLSSSSSTKDEGSAAAPAAPKSQICLTCGGEGVEKTIYNHSVRERTCRTCEGEGVTLIAKAEAKGEMKDEKCDDKKSEKADSAAEEDALPPLV